MTFRYDSQLVYLANSLIYCLIFCPTDGLQPSVSHIAANLEIAGRVDAQTVKITLVLCPKNQAAGYVLIARRHCDFYANVGVVKDVRLIQYNLRCVRRRLKCQLTIVYANLFTRCTPARIQVGKVILIKNIPCKYVWNWGQQQERHKARDKKGIESGLHNIWSTSLKGGRTGPKSPTPELAAPGLHSGLDLAAGLVRVQIGLRRDQQPHLSLGHPLAHCGIESLMCYCGISQDRHSVGLVASFFLLPS